MILAKAKEWLEDRIDSADDYLEIYERTLEIKKDNLEFYAAKKQEQIDLICGAIKDETVDTDPNLEKLVEKAQRQAREAEKKARREHLQSMVDVKMRG